MNQRASVVRPLLTRARELDVAVHVICALCLLAVISADAAQRWVLPIGGLLALPMLVSLAWRAVRRRMGRDDLATIAVGLSGGVLLMVVQWQLRRIPWLSACTDCLGQYPWYSFVLTFCQGLGWLASGCVAVRWLRRRAARATA